MTKADLLTLILSSNRSDASDRKLAKSLAASTKHTLPKLGLINIARRVTQSKLRVSSFL